MVQIHNIEIQKEFAEAILCGDKTFVVRLNDRGYQKGDLIRFRVPGSTFRNPSHELSQKTYKITYVLSGWGLDEGYVALAIREVDKNEKT